MIEIKTSSENIGSVQVADEVVAIIAGTAAMEVDGVVAPSGNLLTGDLAEMLGKKNLAKGVRVTVNDNIAVIDITIQVKFGHKIKEVSEEVQKRVKNAVETMIGLTAPEVNINVSGVFIDKENKKTEANA